MPIRIFYFHFIFHFVPFHSVAVILYTPDLLFSSHYFSLNNQDITHFSPSFSFISFSSAPFLSLNFCLLPFQSCTFCILQYPRFFPFLASIPFLPLSSFLIFLSLSSSFSLFLSLSWLTFTMDA